VGHEKVHAYDMNIDLMSFSAHKFYGPKGVGGLFVRSFSPMVRLVSVSFGGGHERGLRPGTLNVPGIVGMAEALKIAEECRSGEKSRLLELSSAIYDEISAAFPSAKRNGHPENRLAHNLSLTLLGIEAKALIHCLKASLSFSAGSACSTTKVEPSHVLKAIGLSDEETFQTIRLGLGRATADPELIARRILEAIEGIRNFKTVS
jgi:cysteine desulfurase